MDKKLQLNNAKRSKRMDLASSSSTTFTIKSKRKVLKEEEYLSALSSILRRDFFPTLDRLEAQYEYLSALERSDIASLRQAAAKLASFHSHPSLSSLDNLSLDEFQARYMTEDTADFEELLAKFNAARRKRYWRLFGQSNNSNGNNNTSSVTSTAITLPSIADGQESKRRLAPDSASQIQLIKGHNNTGESRVQKEGGITQVHCTRFLDKDQVEDHEENHYTDDDDDVSCHYKAMLREYAPTDTFAPHHNDWAQKPKIAPAREYEFVETPLAPVPPTPLRFTQPTSKRAPSSKFPPSINKSVTTSISQKQKAALLSSPAVRRFLRAQTPGRDEKSSFDTPILPAHRYNQSNERNKR